MPMPLSPGSHFYIARRSMSSNYEMPTMEAAHNYYIMGYHICGDRTTITPNMTYTQHAGYLGTIAPHLYHRTIPASGDAYENILVKFTADFVKPFTDVFGMHTLDRIYANPTNRFEPSDRDKIYHLLSEMIVEYQGDSPYKDFKLQCMLFQVLIIILEKRLPDTDIIRHHTPLTPPIMEAVYHMENHYAEKLSLKTAAKAAGFSSAYFSRLFHSQLGSPYSEYLNSIRLRHVQELLLHTNKSITEIALETGYAYPGNLTAQFKKKTGLSPLHFRKMGQS